MSLPKRQLLRPQSFCIKMVTLSTSSAVERVSLGELVEWWWGRILEEKELERCENRGDMATET